MSRNPKKKILRELKEQIRRKEVVFKDWKEGKSQQLEVNTWKIITSVPKNKNRIHKEQVCLQMR